MILAAHTSRRPAAGLLPDLARVLRAHLPRPRDPGTEERPPSTETALVRALCHDMHGSLACLESALRHLRRQGSAPDDMVALAQAQAAHLSSMLRTAEATGGASARRPLTGRPLRDVVAASVAASGLPRRQLTVEMSGSVGEVAVGDARVQRILVNLLENAHRHGGGAAVRLGAASGDGWVELAVTQAGVPATRVIGHLRTPHPPVDLTGLGLWSVQRQAWELGGRILWDDDGGALTLRVRLPDR